MLAASPVAGAPADPAGIEPSGTTSEDASGSPGDPEEGGIGIQLLEVPAERADDPRANRYIVDHLRPGAVIERRVEVTNTTARHQQVELYATGASVDQNVFTGFEGRGANELSEWTTVDEPAFELAPGESTTATITVEVPEGVERGERYAAVFAQLSAPDTAANVIQVHRVGIRMYLDVGPGGEAPTDFDIGDVTVSGEEQPVVTAHVRNTGERALDMTGNLTLSRKIGNVTAGPFPAETGVTILPGKSGEVRVPIDKSLPGGEWKAALVLASGTEERTAERSLTLPGPIEAASAEPGRTPLVVSAAAAAAATLIFCWAFRGARRRSRSVGDT